MRIFPYQKRYYYFSKNINIVSLNFKFLFHNIESTKAKKFTPPIYANFSPVN